MNQPSRSSSRRAASAESAKDDAEHAADASQDVEAQEPVESQEPVPEPVPESAPAEPPAPQATAKLPRAELMSDATLKFGVSGHVVAGALYGRDGDEFTIEETRDAVSEFLKRPVS